MRMSIAYTPDRLILAFRRRARPSRPTLVVLHTNEGPESKNGAVNLANYCANPHPPDNPGYHCEVDDSTTVASADDMETTNGAGGVNTIALHICFVSYAHQTSGEWHDPFSTASLKRAATVVRAWCDAYNIPVRRDPSTIWGICSHGDVSALHSASKGHTDPGPNFPWDEFLELVRHPHGIVPTMIIPADDEEEDPMIPVARIPYNNALNTFWVDAGGRVWQVWDGGSGPNLVDLTGLLNLGPVIQERPSLATTPDGDLVVGVRGVDGIFNEIRYDKQTGVWVQHVWK